MSELGFPFEAVSERKGALPIIAVIALTERAEVELWAAVYVVGPPKKFRKMPMHKALRLW